MANVKTKLDTRRPKADCTYNIIYHITHYKKVYTINLGVAILDHLDEHKQFGQLLNLKIKKEDVFVEQS